MRSVEIEALVSGHMTELRAAARSYARSSCDTDEAVARALLILTRHQERLRSDTALAWLKTVVRHEALAVVRSRQDVPADDYDFTAIPADQRPLEEVVDSGERVTHAAATLRALPRDHAAALLLHAHGFSYEEIAAREGWTFTKVNRSVTEGRRLFRAVYRDTHEGGTMTAIEAPYGYKADGTPRKRPVPAAAIAARRRNGQARVHAAVSPADAKSLITPPVTFDQLVRDIDQEIIRREEEAGIPRLREALAALRQVST